MPRRSKESKDGRALQYTTMRPLLESEKIVFLIEDELDQYPIDFKERFGIDYSHYTVKPVSIQEVTRLVWHTQLSTHNSGDFFNEVFDNHPNLICFPSLMMSNITDVVEETRAYLDKVSGIRGCFERTGCPPGW